MHNVPTYAYIKQRFIKNLSTHAHVSTHNPKN